MPTSLYLKLFRSYRGGITRCYVLKNIECRSVNPTSAKGLHLVVWSPFGTLVMSGSFQFTKLSQVKNRCKFVTENDDKKSIILLLIHFKSLFSFIREELEFRSIKHCKMYL